MHRLTGSNIEQIWKAIEEKANPYELRVKIVKDARIPKKWQIRGAERLLELASCGFDFTWLIAGGPEECKEKAWNKFLQQKPSNKEILPLLVNTNEEYQAKAWEVLERQGFTLYDLNWIIINGSEKYKNKAREIRTRKELENEQLEKLKTKSMGELIEALIKATSDRDDFLSHCIP